jgi:hypothetical protein
VFSSRAGDDQEGTYHDGSDDIEADHSNLPVSFPSYLHLRTCSHSAPLNRLPVPSWPLYCIVNMTSPCRSSAKDPILHGSCSPRALLRAVPGSPPAPNITVEPYIHSAPPINRSSSTIAAERRRDSRLWHWRASPLASAAAPSCPPTVRVKGGERG